ncbi:MAG: DUF4129 domain-containing protein [Gemmatimonadetes bacterium]|nr:DUF4129 domain-containing protein [Gemmatimonadota bacterium]
MQSPLPRTEPVGPTPEQVGRALGRVYARPEFAERRASPLMRWLTDWYGRLHDAFWELVHRFQLMERSAPVVYWLILAWLTLSALAILAHFATTGYQAWRGRERKSAGGPRGVPRPGHRPLDAAGWEAEARRAAAEGRLRDAALALYQALLLRLHDRGALRYEASKTPGDYRREARGNAEVSRTLDAFLRRFEPVAFGGRSLDGAGYEALRRIVDQGGAHG